ncbi:HlyD family efflux transporter periplasmic adaptor subunit [bacterium]|nr:HlyD family efflux transporter periplasmic adaptor subunit [bacterium]
MKKLLFVLSIAVFIAAGCSNKNSRKIIAAGVIDGNIIHVKSGTSGIIDRLNAEEGRIVSPADTLVYIDYKKIENQIQELRIQEKSIILKRTALVEKQKFLNQRLSYLSDQVNKLKRLSKHDAVSEDNLKLTDLKKKEAETSLFDLQVQLKNSDLELGRIRLKREYLLLLKRDHIITAPVKGTVLEIFSRRGEQVFPRDMIMDILASTGLYAEVFLEEEEVNSLALGDTAKIFIDGVDQEVNGVVSYFGKKAEFSPKYIISEKERKNLLFQVKVAINPNSAKSVKIGQLVTVVFSGRDRKPEDN